MIGKFNRTVKQSNNDFPFTRDLCPKTNQKRMHNNNTACKPLCYVHVSSALSFSILEGILNERITSECAQNV